MKKYSKITLFIAIAFILFLHGTNSLASTYSDEGISFYVQPSFGYSSEGTAFYLPITQLTDSSPVYRFYNSKNGDHFYTISQTDVDTINNNPDWGYSNEGVTFYAYSSLLSNTTPVYRYYNSNTGDHFYTSSESDVAIIKNNPQWGYSDEGIAFYANSTQVSNTFPVYRFYNPKNGDHFYTTSQDDFDRLTIVPVYRFYNYKNGDHFFTASQDDLNNLNNHPSWGYSSEGVAFYASTKQVSGSSPVYRFYNSKNGDHFYTISQTDVDTINNNPGWGYSNEGISFYAFSTKISGSLPIYRFYNSTTGDHFYTASESERYALLTPPQGPEISVGLWYYNKSDFMSNSFKIDANKPYIIKDASGNILTQANGTSTTTVNYNDSANAFTVNVASYSNNNSSKTLTFEAADGNNTDLVFDTHNSNFSDWKSGLGLTHYRGKIKVQYYRGPDIYNDPSPTGTTDITQIWIDNILPLEQYTWGAAELKGTGNINHTMVMVTAYRTYGFRWIKYANYYAALGFKIRSDSGSQNYGGFDWETKYPNIKKAAEQTRGTLVSYNGDAANTPYSKWSDGNTVSSPSYAWCKAKKDSYGNYNDSYWNNGATKSHDTLVAEGNHMIGLIAQGSVRMAVEGWNWQDILRYYYSGIGLVVNY